MGSYDKERMGYLVGALAPMELDGQMKQPRLTGFLHPLQILPHCLCSCEPGHGVALRGSEVKRAISGHESQGVSQGAQTMARPSGTPETGQVYGADLTSLRDHYQTASGHC